MKKRKKTALNIKKEQTQQRGYVNNTDEKMSRDGLQVRGHASVNNKAQHN